MRRLATALLLLAALPGCSSILGIDRPVGKDCTLPDDGSCGEGQMCDFDQGAGRLACRPIGTNTEGMPCDQVDDCTTGLSCTDGLCRTLCTDTSDCSTGGPGEAQCGWSNGDAYVCNDDCDVTAIGTCPAGYECEIEFDRDGMLASACVPTGWFGNAQLDEDCNDVTECIESLGCWDADGDGTGQCTKLCVVGNDTCDTGQTCHSIGTLNGIETGLCIAQ